MNAFKKMVEQAVAEKILQVPHEKGPEYFTANLQKKKQLAKQLQSELVQFKADLSNEKGLTPAQIKEADKVIQAALQKFMMA